MGEEEFSKTVTGQYVDDDDAPNCTGYSFNNRTRKHFARRFAGSSGLKGYSDRSSSAPASSGSGWKDSKGSSPLTLRKRWSSLHK